jgi:hypothetical protein
MKNKMQTWTFWTYLKKEVINYKRNERLSYKLKKKLI